MSVQTCHPTEPEPRCPECGHTRVAHSGHVALVVTRDQVTYWQRAWARIEELAAVADHHIGPMLTESDEERAIIEAELAQALAGLVAGVEAGDSPDERGAGMDEKQIQILCIEDGRPICPACGEPLYAAEDSYTSGIIPGWPGPHGGFYLDGGTHDESELVSLYCSCGWNVDPRTTDLVVRGMRCTGEGWRKIE